MGAKRLHFLNLNATPRKPPTFWSTLGDVWTKVWNLVVILLGITVGCAVLYYIGTPHGWGIQPTFIGNQTPSTATDVSFFDCLHFSVVTIATLGYGDYRPESYGRLIAALEVFGGIVLMGVFVARLVSRQQDRMTRRIARGQLNAEIQDFRDQLARLLQTFKEAPPVLVKQAPSATLFRARGMAMSIGRYWRHEAMEQELVDFLPVRAAGRLLGEMIELLQAIAGCVAGQTKETLHYDDFKAVRSITESTLAVATVLQERVSDAGLKHSQQRVVELVSNLRKQLHLHRKHRP